MAAVDRPIQISLSGWCSFSDLGVDSGCHTAFRCHVPVASCHLGVSRSLLLLRLLKGTGRKLCRMSLHLGLSRVPCGLDSDAFLARMPRSDVTPFIRRHTELAHLYWWHFAGLRFYLPRVTVLLPFLCGGYPWGRGSIQPGLHMVLLLNSHLLLASPVVFAKWRFFYHPGSCG